MLKPTLNSGVWIIHCQAVSELEEIVALKGNNDKTQLTSSTQSCSKNKELHFKLCCAPSESTSEQKSLNNRVTLRGNSFLM